ncbi:MAG: saccharopine dehydrogenase C-terminal domain-containing protein, partial [Thermoanaerobaculia bacterium]
MKQILVLGAGKSARYLIHHLLDEAQEMDSFITVADMNFELARACVTDHPRGSAIQFDVNDKAHRTTQISNADVVVNMLAPRFQSMIATDCIYLSRHMISVSYEDDAVRALAPDAQRQGVLLLTELGIDPGVDHMSAMALIRRVRDEAGAIRSFCSYGCGLPAPDSRQNPMRYAITWNPRNVVMAGEMGAQYLENGRIKIVPHHEVFQHTWQVEVDGIGILEAYPNRDSLAYLVTFGLENAHTIIRGTLRYPGWSETWAQIVKLGLPNETVRIPNLAERSYREVVEMFLPENATGPGIEQHLARYLNISPTGRIMENLRWLGLFSKEPTGCQQETAAAMMIELLERKLPLEADERDIIILQHKLEVEYPDPQRSPEVITSTLAYEGESGGFSAMSKTVGFPTAIAVRLVLEGKIPLTGAQ